MSWKHGRVLFSCLLLAAAAGCVSDRSYLDEAQRVQYSYVQDSNWAVLEQPADPAVGFDIFYIYPTLISGTARPVMNWHKIPEQREKAVAFSKLQLDLLRAPNVGIYAPLVQQADLEVCKPYLEKGECDWDLQPVRLGIDDTIRAFRFYRGAYGKKRPFVLIGHSQGAIDLYRLLARCPEITVEKGFVAAYLIGLPQLSARQIERDLAANGIKVARTADDFGVVVGWNTTAEGAANPVFCIARSGEDESTYVINPVTWTAGAEASPVQGAFHLGKKLRLLPVPDAFSVRADAKNGTLRVDLAADSVYDNHGKLFGAGVMHGNDFFFFAPYIRENMARRVEAWRKRPAKPAPAVPADASAQRDVSDGHPVPEKTEPAKEAPKAPEAAPKAA